MNNNKIVLPNGLRLIYERLPHLRSVTVGVWMGAGSRCETHFNNGISHFIEHMLFKGTAVRSAKDIAELVDSIGGHLDAFTSKECTCLFAKTLDSHIDVSMELLSDMFFNSTFHEDCMITEKNVILEEIGSYEDAPEELVHDLICEAAWGDSPLGYPILGSKKSLQKFNREVLVDYLATNYMPKDTVISVVGNFEEARLLDLVNKYFGTWNSAFVSPHSAPPSSFIPSIKIKRKKTEQEHICMGFNGLEYGHDDFYTLLAFNSILGGGISSRLFQKVREDKGLAYSIYSYLLPYRSEGLYAIYAGTNISNFDSVMDIIAGEITSLISAGVTEVELSRSKEQLKGNFILGMESTTNRMNSYAKSELLLGIRSTPEEVLGKIDSITMDGMNRVIKGTLGAGRVSFAGIGSMKPEVVANRWLKA